MWEFDGFEGFDGFDGFEGLVVVVEGLVRLMLMFGGFSCGLSWLCWLCWLWRLLRVWLCSWVMFERGVRVCVVLWVLGLLWGREVVEPVLRFETLRSVLWCRLDSEVFSGVISFLECSGFRFSFSIFVISPVSFSISLWIIPIMYFRFVRH